MEGMYWGDFKALIERNKKSYSIFRYYRSKEGFSDTMSICDFNLPRRTGVVVETGYSADDWYRDSYVCNTSYFNGFTPMRNEICEWDDKDKSWVTKPARGVADTLRQLVSQGCVARTDEVRRIING